jgi:hypothetical protein
MPDYTSDQLAPNEYKVRLYGNFPIKNKSQLSEKIYDISPLTHTLPNGNLARKLIKDYFLARSVKGDYYYGNENSR